MIDVLAQESEPQGAWDPYKALYIHVPFCKSRCVYCDFPTEAVRSDDSRLDAYVEGLVSQIRRASRAGLLGKVETVYIGGGTPSYLGNRRLSSLLYALSLSMHLTPEVECTLEANPDSLDVRMVRDAYALGVTRISLGVQSFDDELLGWLGRAHDSKAARRAIMCAQDRFENVSIDVMCGLPGQTTRRLVRDLREALALGVRHVSVYPLMVEEGTPLERAVAAGIRSVDEDAGAEGMECAARVLEGAGLRRYEVASYAYPGFESRHNQAYWTGKPYLGLGVGAVSMRQNAHVRQRIRDGVLEDELKPPQRAAEDLMLGMRRSEGVSDAAVKAASLLLPEALPALCALAEEGYVTHDQGAWRPTHKGWLFGNVLYGRLLDLAP